MTRSYLPEPVSGVKYIIPLLMAIGAEDFARWRDDAVTRWIFKAIEAGEAENKAAWIEASWQFNNPSPSLLLELRTRADAYRALIDTTYEAWCEMNQQEGIYD